VLTSLDWKGLESSLIEVAGADSFVCRVPAHGVRVRQPAEKVRHFAFTPGLEDEVPMIPHDAIRQNPRRMFFKGLVDDAEECLVIRRLLERRHD